MAEKLNCWEFEKCGREHGGKNVDSRGVCPVAEAAAVNGVHGGKNGGRCCWVVADTLCKNKVQGSFIIKVDDCKKCEFYKQVHEEEGEDIVPPFFIIHKMENDIR